MTEMFVRKPGGSEGTCIEVSAGPLRRKDGVVCGGVAAFRDGREAKFTGVAPEPIHPVRLVVSDDLRRWRLTVLLRLLLALPHLVLATAWLYLGLVVAIASWAATAPEACPPIPSATM